MFPYLVLATASVVVGTLAVVELRDVVVPYEAASSLLLLFLVVHPYYLPPPPVDATFCPGIGCPV